MAEASRTREFGRRAAASFVQDGLWFLHRLVPDSAAHNICRAFLVNGRLDRAALRAAWGTLLGRHEILRTTFAESAGRPLQQVSANVDPKSFVDLGRVPADRPEAPAARIAADRAARPLDPADGPLAQLVVAELGETEQQHVVVLVLHRAVADEASASAVLTELSTHYAAALAGGTVPVALPASPAQYADFTRWQRDRFLTRGLVGQLDWWSRALTPQPDEPNLPVDRQRPPDPAVRGAAERFDWGLATGRRVAELAAAVGTTPSVVVLAAYQALLWRYGTGERVAVAAEVPVRPETGFDGLLGPLSNLVVLCTDLAGRPTFRELVARVDGVLNEAVDRRELPFGLLVRALRVDRDPRRLPLCDAMFGFPEDSPAELRIPAAVARLPVHNGAARADLALLLDQVQPSVAGALEYRTDLFEPATVRLVLGQLHTMLTAALAGPDRPVDQLPMATPEATEAAMRAGDQVAAAMPAELPVHLLVRRQAELRPDAAAIRWDGAEVGYRELDRRAAAVSTVLRAAGVAGSAVVVRMPPGPDRIAALLAVLDAGAHLSWFGTADSGDRGRAVLADLRPACVLVEGEPASDEPAGDELLDWYRAELGGRVLSTASASGTGPAPGAAVRLTDRAYVAHTSGSTGRPKGIPQSHAAFAQFVTWMAGAFDLGPGSRVAQWVAPEHDPALCEVFATLVAGATLCPIPDRLRRNPDKLVGWLADEQITVIQLVPSFARELLKVIVGTGAAGRLGSLDRILLMGEALPGELVTGLLDALPRVGVANLYGPTETIAATWHEVSGPIAGTVPIGLPIPGRQVLVVDDNDRICPPGVTGEIVIRSPHVTPGYVGAGGGRSGAFRPLPEQQPRDAGRPRRRTYRTGDLARWRPDGLLEFRGRKDFQIKLLGNRLELSEVEAALAEEPSVLECAVVAITDRHDLANRLVAYVVPAGTTEGSVVPAGTTEGSVVPAGTTEGSVVPAGTMQGSVVPAGTTQGSAETWRAHLRRRFGRGMLPVSFVTMDQRLPRNVGGKVDRRRLPPPDRAAGPAARPPRSANEQRIAQLWRELLGVPRVTADDTLFTAGGDSLLVLQLVHRVRELFGVQVAPIEYFAHPTLAAFAALVESMGGQVTPVEKRPAGQNQSATWRGVSGHDSQ